MTKRKRSGARVAAGRTSAGAQDVGDGEATGTRHAVNDSGANHESMSRTTATVVGYPNRTNPQEMRAERITIEGKTVELR